MLEGFVKLNGKSVILKELIDAVKTSMLSAYIPEYQRNYKWNAEGAISAVKLLEDLLETYQLKKDKSVGLVTLYIDQENKKLHILDGQQRIVTFLLIFTALKKAEEFFPIEFQRDEGLEKGFDDKRTRKRYVETLAYSMDFAVIHERGLSDKRRFQYNYNKICDRLLRESVKSDFVVYMKEHIRFLLHISDIKPVDEFLNLNCYKTKFSICDRVRSKLIIYAAFHGKEVTQNEMLRYILPKKNYKEAVSYLFERLSYLLYDDNIYSLVKRGKDPDKTKENRINIIFAPLIVDTAYGYMSNLKYDLNDDEEIDLLKRLIFYLHLLEELKESLDKGDFTWRNEILALKKKITNFDFFKMLDENIDKYKGKVGTDKILGQILHTTSSLDKLLFEYSKKSLTGKDALICNTMFNVLSYSKEECLDDKWSSVVNDVYEGRGDSGRGNRDNYVTMNVSAFEDTVQTSGKYMLYRYFNKQTLINNTLLHFPYDEIKIDDLDADNEEKSQCSRGAKSENDIPKKITVEDLIKYEIFIPMVQRDYCIGMHFSDNENNLLSYLLSYLKKEYSEDGTYPTLSAIAIRSQGKRIYLYDGQQRIVTLALLLKLSGYEEQINFIFEGRGSFQHFFNEVQNDSESSADSKEKKASYAQAAVENLKSMLNKRLQKADLDGLKNFLLKVKFDVVKIDGNVSDAEQYFMDINDGVQLKPYEIFKCKLNTKVKELYGKEQQEEKNNQWICLVENDLTDSFYRWKNIKLDDEGAEHEVAVMQLLEYLLRMMYNEAEISGIQDEHKVYDKIWKILAKKSFSEESAIGDIDKFINHLEYNDECNSNLEFLCEIVRSFLKWMLDIQELNQQKKLGGRVTAPKEDSFKTMDNRYKFVQYKFSDKCNWTMAIKQFLDGLGTFDVAQDNSLEYFGSRQFDIIMWMEIKKRVGREGADPDVILKVWSESIICGPVVFLAPGFIGSYDKVVLPVQKYYISDKDYRTYYSKQDMSENRTNLPAFLFVQEERIIVNCRQAISHIFKNANEYNIGLNKQSNGKYKVFYRHFQGRKIRGLEQNEIEVADARFFEDGSVRVKVDGWYLKFGIRGKGFMKPDYDWQ